MEKKKLIHLEVTGCDICPYEHVVGYLDNTIFFTYPLLSLFVIFARALGFISIIISPFSAVNSIIQLG